MHADSGKNLQKNLGLANGVKEPEVPVMSTGQHTESISFFLSVVMPFFHNYFKNFLDIAAKRS